MHTNEIEWALVRFTCRLQQSTARPFLRFHTRWNKWKRQPVVFRFKISTTRIKKRNKSTVKKTMHKTPKMHLLRAVTLSMNYLVAGLNTHWPHDSAFDHCSICLCFWLCTESLFVRWYSISVLLFHVISMSSPNDRTQCQSKRTITKNCESFAIGRFSE